MKSKNAAPEQSERLHMRISPEEITAIDDWRFANRVPSRSEAVRRLVQIGSRLEPQLQPICDLILSQLERHEALGRIIDGLMVNRTPWVSDDAAMVEGSRRAKLLWELVGWEYEAYREALELTRRIELFVEQYNLLAEHPEFDDALNLAERSRAVSETLRTIWESRKAMKIQAGDADETE